MLHAQPNYIILPAVPEDAEKVIDCGRKAFASTPIQEAVYPKAKEHLTPPAELRRWRIHRKAGRMAGEDVVGFKAVLVADPDAIVGYASWVKPGGFDKQKNRAELEPAVEKVDFPACVNKEAQRDFTARLDRKREEIWDGDWNFWYLAALGVDPDCQRQGIAAALLQWGLDQADAQGLPAYLEATPEGAPVYPRFGFQTLEVMDMLNGTHRVAIMLRQPRTSIQSSGPRK